MVYCEQLCKDVMRLKKLINDQNGQLGTIRDYYDHNTARFLSYGEQRKARAIHRPAWGEGVKDAGQALHYVHNLILDDLLASLQGVSGDVHVLDMGCGVGASLFYLAANIDVELNCVGLTISPVQDKIALEKQEDQDTEQKCKIVLGDFLKPPLRKGYNLIYAIESFTHSAAPDSFLKAAADLLKPGGRLVLCDDFLVRSSQGNLISKREKRWLRIFQSKWRVDGLS
jgi:cyclopropane fatty-acyl-phospholipid synthase-like methyltransferase